MHHEGLSRGFSRQPQPCEAVVSIGSVLITGGCLIARVELAGRNRAARCDVTTTLLSQCIIRLLRQQLDLTIQPVYIAEMIQRGTARFVLFIDQTGPQGVMSTVKPRSHRGTCARTAHDRTRLSATGGRDRFSAAWEHPKRRSVSGSRCQSPHPIRTVFNVRSSSSYEPHRAGSSSECRTSSGRNPGRLQHFQRLASAWSAGGGVQGITQLESSDDSVSTCHQGNAGGGIRRHSPKEIAWAQARVTVSASAERVENTIAVRHDESGSNEWRRTKNEPRHSL